MTLGSSLHPLAQRELDQAVDQLELERPGTGLALAAAVESAIGQLCELPFSGPVSRGEIRSKLVLPTSRWSYTIFYRVKREHIRVLAVAHQRRQPFYWLSRR